MKRFASIVLLLFSTQAISVEIDGTVRDAAGNNASVVTQSDLIPNAGDDVEIFFKMPQTGDEITVGTARVSEVSGDAIRVTIEEAYGTVVPNQLARIFSDNPTKRGTAPPPTIDAGGETLDGTRSLGLGGDTAQVAGPGKAQPVSTSAKGCIGFAGAWRTNVLGRVNLNQDGATVSGTYDRAPNDHGTLRGTVAGKAVGGEWLHLDGRNGKFQLELSADGNRLTGEVTTTGWVGRVDGTCVSGPSQPTSVDAGPVQSPAPVPVPQPAPGPQPVGSSAEGCVGFAGKWNTDHGELYLDQTANRVTGTYAWKSGPGRISGQVTGQVFEGDFVSDRQGKLRMTLLPDGNSFRAISTEADGTGAGSWGATCAGPPETIAMQPQPPDKTIDAGCETMDGTRSRCPGQPAPPATPTAAPQPGDDLLQQILGLWQAEGSGSVYEILPNGTSIFREPSAGSAALGYKAGDVSLSKMRVTGRNSLEAEMWLRPQANECDPSFAPAAAKTTIEVQPDRNKMTLSIRAPGYTGSGSACTWTDQRFKTLSSAMVRLGSTAQAPAPGPTIDAGCETMDGTRSRCPGQPAPAPPTTPPADAGVPQAPAPRTVPGTAPAPPATPPLAADSVALALARGHQTLPIDYKECLARAHRAFSAEGFTASPSAGESFVRGTKANYAAYITCGVDPQSRADVNVFVATEGTRDNTVPALERDRLQRRMYEPTAAMARTLPVKEMVTVPDFSVSGSAAEMKNVAEQSGLVLALTAASVATPSKDLEFRAESQSPAPGAQVKKNSTVTVAIYQQYQEPEVVVPDLKGTGVAEIKAALDEAGLKGAFTAAAVAAPSKDLEFKAESQSPAAGTKVKRDSTVTVAVYQQYQEPEVTVPDVTGIGTAEAKAALEKAGLQGTFIAASVATPSKAVELKAETQDPPPGSKVKKDSTVTVAIYPPFQEPPAPPIAAVDPPEPGTPPPVVDAPPPTPRRTAPIAPAPEPLSPPPVAHVPPPTPPPPQPTTPTCSDFTGDWETDWGRVSLVQNGAQVTGSYMSVNGPGRITGEVFGDDLQADWVQPDRPGKLRLTLAADRRTFAGTWTEADGTGGGPWNGTCISGIASHQPTSEPPPPVAHAPPPTPDPTSTTSTPATPTEPPAPPSSVTTPASTPIAGSPTYLGCFKDQGAADGTEGRDLDGAIRSDGGMTSAMCIDECRAQGFAYAGTQYSSYCFCGNRYGASGPADNCDMPCAGDPDEICGGAAANSVYAIGGETPIAHDPAVTTGNIEVVAGTYGGNCPREQFGDAIDHGNVTAHLAAACNGKKSCDYTVDYTLIGDPAYGCEKTYVAEWRCGGDSTVHQAQAAAQAGETGYGSIVSLSCDPAAGASNEPTAASAVE